MVSLACFVASVGCAGRAPRAIDLPRPIEMNTLGVGDKFELRIAGEDKFPTTYEVAPDGTADFPFIKRLKIDGLEPQEVAQRVREELVKQEYYSEPSVSVVVSSYNSKRIEVIGEVKKPGSFPLEPGMTLLRVISLAGGLTSIGDASEVTIRRKLKGGGVKRASVNLKSIINNEVDDVPLQAGDSVNVDASIF